MKYSKPILSPTFWLIAAILSAACMGFYAKEIWGAGQSPRFSDLYAPWWGAHEVLLHGRDPYTLEVAAEIQTVIYGARPVPEDSVDFPQQFAGGFAYPLYAAFLLWPLIHLTFLAAKIAVISVSAVGTLASLVLWLRALQFRASPIEWLTLTLFTLGSFPVIQGIELQNLSLIAAALIALTIVLLANGHPLLAGVLLAVSTFKPQFTVLLVPWLALWAASDWRRRQALAWSFVASMLLLIGAGELILPGWIGNFLRVAHAYTLYTYGHSLLDVWFTPRLGPFAAAILLLGVMALCWKCRQEGAESQRFLFAVTILLAATSTVIPTLAPHTQLLLLPGYLSLYRYRPLLGKSGRFARLVLVALCLLLAWPWIAAAALTMGGLGVVAGLIPTNAILALWKLPLYTSPLLPLATLSALCCLVRITGSQAMPNSMPNYHQRLPNEKP